MTASVPGPPSAPQWLQRPWVSGLNRLKHMRQALFSSATFLSMPANTLGKIRIGKSQRLSWAPAALSMRRADLLHDLFGKVVVGSALVFSFFLRPRFGFLCRPRPERNGLNSGLLRDQGPRLRFHAFLTAAGPTRAQRSISHEVYVTDTCRHHSIFQCGYEACGRSRISTSQ